MEALVGRAALLEFRPQHPADMPATWANTDKAGTYLGWEPQLNIEQGLRGLVDWYRAERGWAADLVTS